MFRRIVVIAIFVTPLHAGEPRVDQYGDRLPEGAIARMGTMRLRHAPRQPGPPPFLSSDGRTIVTVADHELRLWDTATGKPRLNVGEDGRRILDARYTPDGRDIAVARADAILLLAAETGRMRRRWDLPRRAQVEHGLFFSPEGKTLVTSQSDADGKFHRWAVGYDVASGERRFALALPERCEAFVALSLAPRVALHAFVLADGDPLVSRWFDVSSGEIIRRVGFDVMVRSADAVSPDGKLVATRNWLDNNTSHFRLLDAVSGKVAVALQDAFPDVHSVTFSADGKTLVATRWTYPEARDEVVFWDTGTGKLLRRFKLSCQQAQGVALSGDGQILATWSSFSGVTCLWDAHTGQRLLATPTHDYWVARVAFSADGKHLISASYDRRLCVWDAATGKFERELAVGRDTILSLAGLHDGNLFSLDQLGVVLWHDLESGERLVVHDMFRDYRRRNETAINHLGSWLSGDPGRLQVLLRGFPGSDQVDELTRLIEIDLSGGRARLLQETRGVYLIHDVSSDGRLCVRTEARPSLNELAQLYHPVPPLAVFKTEDGRPLFDLRHDSTRHASATFSPDGQAILSYTPPEPSGAARDGDAVHLWETRSGQVRHSFRLPGKEPYPVHAFSADGRLVVAGMNDGSLYVCEARTGRHLGRLTAVGRGHGAFAFRPDGKAIAFGDLDGTTLVWDLSRFAPRAGMALTPAELSPRWEALANLDARKAYAAMLELIDTGAPATEFLVARLKPAAPPPAERVRQWVADLNDQRFERRRAAEQALARHADVLRDELRAAAVSAASAEAQKRLEAILNQAPLVTDPEELRALRAVEVLERVGTVEAKRALEVLATGAPAARLTRDARAARERLDAKR